MKEKTHFFGDPASFANSPGKRRIFGYIEERQSVERDKNSECEIRLLRAMKYRRLNHGEWLARRTIDAVAMLQDSTEVNPLKRGGIPVLKGTRFTLAQILAELAEGRSVSSLAEDFGLELAFLTRFLHGLAIIFDRSFSSEPAAWRRSSNDHLPARSVRE